MFKFGSRSPKSFPRCHEALGSQSSGLFLVTYWYQLPPSDRKTTLLIQNIVIVCKSVSSTGFWVPYIFEIWESDMFWHRTTYFPTPPPTQSWCYVTAYSLFLWTDLNAFTSVFSFDPHCQSGNKTEDITVFILQMRNMKFIKGEIELSPPPSNGKGRLLPYHSTSRDYIWFGNDFSKLNTKMLNLFYSCIQQETDLIDTIK